MVTMADIADHIESHHGDWNAFLTGELQSLCSACHAQKARPFCYDGRRILSLARFRAKEAARRRTRQIGFGLELEHAETCVRRGKRRRG